MREIYSNLKSDILKIQYLTISYIHIFVPLLGGIVFLFYFYRYNNYTTLDKYYFLFELVAVMFPVLIGFISSYIIEQEKKCANFHNMLGVTKKKVTTLISKIILQCVMGLLSGIFLIILFVLGKKLLNINSDNDFSLLFLCIAMTILLVCNIVLYLISNLISLKWGSGSTIFFGVVGSMLVFMFSNVIPEKIWYFIPWTWGIKITKDLLATLNNGSDVKPTIINFIIILFITAVTFLLIRRWFNKWEGRRTSD